MNKLALLTLLLVLNANTCVAGSPLADDHMWAHLGTAYAVQNVTYGIAKQFTDDRTEAVIASAILTCMATTAYMLINTSGPNNRDFAMDRLGQGLAIGTIYGFKF